MAGTTVLNRLIGYDLIVAVFAQRIKIQGECCMKLKKWLLGFMTFAAMVVLCAVCAGAETYGDFEYDVLDSGTVKITKYIGNAEKVDIPAEIYGKSVTSIGDWAFENCTSLTSITIPDSVTSIEWYAFQGCTSLTSITIPNSVTSIGDLAFDGCTSLTSITIPDSVTSIGKSAFYGCTSLTSITIPNSVTSISGSAFSGCSSLTSIMIPNSVTWIGDWAFNGCTSLKSVTIPNGVMSIGEYAFRGCKSLTSITIPSSVTCIGDSAFEDCTSLTSITIPNGVTSIGDSAFEGCTSLTSITIPNSVTSIGFGAFIGCSSLTSITIPDSVTCIGDSAFNGCTSLTSITIPDSVTSIGESAFSGCSSLASITIPDSVMSIGNDAFHECSSLTSITIPNSVTSIGDYAFLGCSRLTAIDVNTDNKDYTSVNGVLFYNDKTIICYPAGKKGNNYKIPDGVTSICRYAFSGCTSLTSITIPDSVTEIGGSAFENCSSLTSITIPDSVTSIGIGAFVGCSSLTSIMIPDNVTYIGGAVFADCSSLTEIKVSTQNAKYVSVNGVLYNKDKTTIMCYPAGKKDKNYKILDGVTEICTSAFNGCSSLTSITIPDSVTEIGVSAFSGCSSLTGITIPDSVTRIDMSTFRGCSSFTSITIPDNVTYIDIWAFNGCTGLTAIDVKAGNNNYTSVNGVLFNKDKTELICYPAGKTDKSYNIPNCVTNVGGWAFDGCTSLTSITIPDSVTEIDWSAFEGCTSLTSITIPDSVTEIGWSAFEGCTSLKSITIPSSVTSIGKNAFGYYFDNEYKKIDNFKIYCYIGTAGEKYAKENGFEYELLDHTQHTFSEWNTTKAATCTTEGTQTRTCEVCGKVETQTIKALGHKEVVDKAVAATCTKTGLTEGKHCSVCNAVIKAQETVPAKGHKYVDTVVKPTYTAQGYTLHKCSVCGNSYKDTYTAKLTLAKVTGVKLTGRAADALRINWTKNANADGYIIEMYQNGKWARVAKITDNSTTTFRKAGLKASSVYNFRVRAYKMSGSTTLYSDYSATVTARTNPSVMTGVKLTGRAADALRINWTKNASADGYIVEMYQGNKWVRVAKITNNNTTTFRKAGLKASTVYKFRVKAYKMSGKIALYGNYSATVAARTNPSVIKGAKLSGRAADALRINWTKNASADGYIVEMYQGGKWVRVAKITSNSTTTFRKAGLSASSVYKFRVRAYKMSGSTALYGNYSATVTARTNPSIVKGVKIGGKAKDALRVNWAKNASAQGYIVEMYKGGKWVRVAKITNGNTTTFRKAGLAKNTTYKFRVCAYYMSGKTALYGNYGSVSGKTAAK